MRAIAYLRVSTQDQADSGLGIEAQRDRLIEEIDRRGWELAEVITDDGYSAKSLDRPGIDRALRMVKAGMADAIVVAKLDRLSRSLLDFAGLMERSRREGWSLVALDLGVDTSTPAGEMMASVMASFAQYERRLIGQRTSDALQALKARGKRLGREVVLPEDVRRTIDQWRHHDGLTFQAIADQLNADGVPTARGGRRWYRSTVAAVIKSIEVDTEMAQIAEAVA